jgi:hypothetical protein
VKHIISTIYDVAKRASLSLYSRVLSYTIKRGLVTCGRRRLHRKRERERLI